MRPSPAARALLALLVVVLTLAGCTRLKARDELNKGVRAYRGAQFDTAIKHFQRAIELDPKLINARIYLAIAYANQVVPGSPTEANKRMGDAAIKAFEDVLGVDPTNSTSISYIASLYYGMKEFEKSKDYRRRLLELEAGNPEHPYWIGVIDWAIAYPVRQEMRNKLGLIDESKPLPRREREQLVAKNNAVVDEGIQMLEKALQMKPDYADAMAYLNLLYRQKSDLVDSPSEREELLKQADDLADRAQQLLKQKAEAPAATQ